MISMDGGCSTIFARVQIHLCVETEQWNGWLVLIGAMRIGAGASIRNILLSLNVLNERLVRKF